MIPNALIAIVNLMATYYSDVMHFKYNNIVTSLAGVVSPLCRCMHVQDELYSSVYTIIPFATLPSPIAVGLPSLSDQMT